MNTHKSFAIIAAAAVCALAQNTIPPSGPVNPAAATTIAEYRMDFSGQNVLMQSGNLGAAVWHLIHASAPSAQQVGPDGVTTVTVWTLTDDTSNTAHTIQQDIAPLASGSAYEVSVFVKLAAGSTANWAYIFSGDDSSASTAYFNVATCATGSITAHTMRNPHATPAGNGFCRISVEHQSFGSRTIGIGLATGDSVTSYTGGGIGQMVAYGPQVVPGTSPVAYASDTADALTLHDSSGHGNDGALGTANSAPRIAGYGLVFTPNSQQSGPIVPEYAYLAQAASKWQTATFELCTDPGPLPNSGTNSGAAWPEFQTLLGATTTDGMMLMNSNGSTNIYEGGWLPAMFNGINSTYPTNAADGNLAGGCHVITYVCGSPNRLYVDGSEVSYNAQASAACTIPSGLPVIGGWPSVPDPTINAFAGTVTYAAFQSAVVPQDVVAHLPDYIHSLTRSRAGYPTYPAVNGSTANQFIAIGDSTTAPFNSGGQAYTDFLTGLADTYTITNYGNSAMTARAESAIAVERGLGQIAKGAAKNVAVIWLGSNDVSIGLSVTSAFNADMKIAKQFHDAGAKVVLGTMMSRGGQDANKNALNALIRQNALASGYVDAIADFGAIPQLGCEGCSTNTTYFSDGFNPTLLSKQTLIGPLVASVVNSLYAGGGASPYKPQVPPLLSMTLEGFTGTAWTPTITTAGDGTIYMSGAGQTIGDIFAGPYMLIAGSAPYEYMLSFWPAASQNDYLLRGIGIRNSTSGKFVSIYLLSKHVDETNTGDRLGYEIVVASHTQPATGAGTFGVSQQVVGDYFPAGPVNLAIQNDGTNFLFYVCSTIAKETCQQVGPAVSNTAWETSYDQVGWFMDTIGYGTDGVLSPANTGVIAPMDVWYFAKVQ